MAFKFSVSNVYLTLFLLYDTTYEHVNYEVIIRSASFRIGKSFIRTNNGFWNDLLHHIKINHNFPLRWHFDSDYVRALHREWTCCTCRLLIARRIYLAARGDIDFLAVAGLIAQRGCAAHARRTPSRARASELRDRDRPRAGPATCPQWKYSIYSVGRSRPRNNRAHPPLMGRSKNSTGLFQSLPKTQRSTKAAKWPPSLPVSKKRSVNRNLVITCKSFVIK